MKDLKILKVLETKKVTIKGHEFLIEIKKTSRVEHVNSVDPRAGSYIDKDYRQDIAYVNGELYSICGCVRLVVEMLEDDGYKNFIEDTYKYDPNFTYQKLKDFIYFSDNATVVLIDHTFDAVVHVHRNVKCIEDVWFDVNIWRNIGAIYYTQSEVPFNK